MNIVLIGMPASGKSTVGVVLAKLCNMNFCDTDLLIQKKHGRKLQEIIDTEGDETFFKYEADVLSELSCNDTVIATGGSAVYSDAAMKHLKDGGICVYLSATAEKIAKRLSDFSKRGVVIKDGMTVYDLYNERKPLYEKYADVTVSADIGSVYDVARRIARMIDR